jgi:hypothetical protein
MNSFVEYGPVVVGPPVECKDAVLFGFFLAADQAKLNKLCTDVFETPSSTIAGGGVIGCSPLDSFVMLTFGTMGWVGNSAVSSLGVQENQVTIQVPVQITTPGGAKTSAWFSAFEFVDNTLSLTGGREVFGIAKGYGDVNLSSLSDPQSLTLTAFGGNKTDQFMTPRIMIAVQRKAPNAAVAGWAELNLTANFLQLFMKWANQGGAPQILMKQFMDAGDSTKACFQQIVQADFSVNLKPPTMNPFGALLYDYDITITQLDSLPVFDQLGIKTQTAHGAFRIEADLVKIDTGKILWTAP